MSDKRLKIKLEIAGKSYDLEIPPRDEEVYRLAARRVNQSVTACQQQHFDGYGIQDYLAMVAVDVMVTNIEQSRSREVSDDQMKRLVALSEAVRKHIDK